MSNQPDPNMTVEDLCRELLWHVGVKDADQYASGDLVGMANALADMLARAAQAERQAILAVVRDTEVGGYFNDADGNEFYTEDANALRQAILDAIEARKDASDAA